MPAPDAGVEWTIEVRGERTIARFEPARVSSAGALFVCAHGAGGHMGDRGVLAVTEALRDRGIPTVRFNFLYRAMGSARPDPMPRLEECLAAVAERVRDELRPQTLVIGGRSMGGRAASMLVAGGFSCDGLLLLAYPLHPAGLPDKLRADHLARIALPVLCLNGTRDPLCRRDLMERVVGGLGPNWTMRWLENADHSFRVLKQSGRTDGDVLAEIADAFRAWVMKLG